MAERIDPVSGKRIVHRVEDGEDRSTIGLTEYQMRNFFRQFADGFFTTLDVMNYIQHHQIVKWCKKDMAVLDVCCGRGLLLPLLRYYAKDIASYTGVDVSRANAIFTHKRVTDNKPLDDPDYYPFPVTFVESNVAVMSEHVQTKPFDIIVYTNSIEHMHKDMGQMSLVECRKLARPGTMLLLSSPNTAEDADGFDTQYRAHVYEWKRSELRAGVKAAGFEIVTEFGLLMDKKTLHTAGEAMGILPVLERIEQFVPMEWVIPMFAPLFPKEAKEIGIIAKAI